MTSGPVETTVYSLSDEAPRPSERRGDKRHLTLFRVGAILIDGRRELCLIKNISAGGMMLRVYGSVQPDQPVLVELKNGVPLAGRVGWVRDGEAGVAFDAPIDILEILANDGARERSRMPRVEVDALIGVRVGASVLRLRAVDVSQGGVKVQAAPALQPGAEAVVTLPGLPPQPGLVRWNENGQAGLSFNRPLALPDLVGWLQARRQAMRAA